MGFLAPVATFLGGPIGSKLLGAGASLGASAIGNKLAGGPQTTPLQDQVFKQNLAAGQLGMDTARQLLPQGQNIFNMGVGALTQPMNYFSSLLSGNRGLATSALAPEISRIGQGYQAAGNTSAALMPRGGASAAFNSEIPFSQQRDISTLMQTMRPQAAQSLFGIGQGLNQAGQGLIGSGISSIYGATAAGRDIVNQQQQALAAAAERGQKLGAGLFDQIKNIGWDQIFKKKPTLAPNIPINTPYGPPFEPIGQTTGPMNF